MTTHLKSHDPLCPVVRHSMTQHLHALGFLEWPVCRCEEYAQVRAHEHAKHMDAIRSLMVSEEIGAPAQIYVEKTLNNLRYRMGVS